MDIFGGETANEYPTFQIQFSGGTTADTSKPPVLSIVAKNVRGLKSDERICELLTELKATEHWDVLILTETWRHDEFEMFATNDGHLFANAGCAAGRRGVGFLIHRKWVKFMRKFTPINERVAGITVQKNNFKIKILGVYFPHCGYPDGDVQQVYNIL